jgi:hypothetical protein
MTDQIELIWDDPEMLMRVIEERFHKATADYNGTPPPEDIWLDFFTPKVKGVSTREWLYKNVLPRPRDLIHFVQKAIEWAINRGHSEIEEEDLLIAHKYYSGFALKQIVAEYKAEKPWLADVTDSFVGKTDSWAFQMLMEHIALNSPDKDENTIRHIIADLVSVGFLGVKYPRQNVEYVVSIQRSLLITSRVRNQPLDDNTEFVINPVFCDHLKIVSGNHNRGRTPKKQDAGFFKRIFDAFRN